MNKIEKSYGELPNKIIEAPLDLQEDSSHCSNSINNSEISNGSSLQASQIVSNSLLGNRHLSLTGNNNNHLNFQLFEIQNNSTEVTAENDKALNDQKLGKIAQSFDRYFEMQVGRVSVVNFEKHVDKSTNKIKQEIIQGKIAIREVPKQIDYSRKIQHKIEKQEHQKKQLQIKRYQTIRKLRQIQQQQIQLIHKSLGRVRSSDKKVIISPEDNQKMVQILKVQKQFELSLQKKKQQMIQRAQKIEREKQQNQKLTLEQKNTRKREKIALNLKQLSELSQKRKQILSNSALRAKHNYAHKQMQRHYKQLQMQNEQQISSKLQQLQQKHRLNIEQINKHDQDYIEMLNKRSLSQSTIRVTSYALPKRAETIFAKLTEEERFETKERNYQQLMKVKQHDFKSKIAKYQQKIDNQHKPRVDPSLAIHPISRTYSVSLSKIQRVQKGLSYLEIAKDLKKEVSNSINIQSEPPKVYGYSTYKDYLKEQDRHSIDPSKQELDQILTNKLAYDDQSMLRAKYLAEGLSAKLKKGSDAKMYYSAKSKLSLLQNLYQY